jgi:arylsulfatase A-like enzyme
MEKLETLTLFNLQHDPSERFDLAAIHPEVIKEIEALVARHKATVVPAKSNLEKRIN